MKNFRVAAILVLVVLLATSKLPLPDTYALFFFLSLMYTCYAYDESNFHLSIFWWWWGNEGEVTVGKYTGRVCGKDFAFPHCEDHACLKFCYGKFGALEGVGGFCNQDGSKCLCFQPCWVHIALSFLSFFLSLSFDAHVREDIGWPAFNKVIVLSYTFSLSRISQISI